MDERIKKLFDKSMNIFSDFRDPPIYEGTITHYYVMLLWDFLRESNLPISSVRAEYPFIIDNHHINYRSCDLYINLGENEKYLCEFKYFGGNIEENDGGETKSYKKLVFVYFKGDWIDHFPNNRRWLLDLFSENIIEINFNLQNEYYYSNK